MKPIDDDKLFNRKVIIYGLESDLNNYDKIEASTVTEVVQEDVFWNTTRKKWEKIYSSIQYEDHLENKRTTKSEAPVASKKLTVEASVDVRTMYEEV